ncbi:MAG: LytTR family transcriptional regulator DNA-binding domain-containing protein [Planctomycetota bacterium]
MDDLAQRPSEDRFLRLHRSAIVRLEHVADMCCEAKKSWLLLRDGTHLPLPTAARAAAARLSLVSARW